MSKPSNALLSPSNKQIKNQTFQFNGINSEMITPTQNQSNMGEQIKQKQDISRMTVIKQNFAVSTSSKEAMTSQQYLMQTPKQSQQNNSQNNFYIPPQYTHQRMQNENGQIINTRNNSSSQLPSHNQIPSHQAQLSTPHNSNSTANSNLLRNQLHSSSSQKIQNINSTNSNTKTLIIASTSLTGSKINSNFNQSTTLPSSPIKIGSMLSLQNSNKKISSSQIAAQQQSSLAQRTAIAAVGDNTKVQSIGHRKYSQSNINQNGGSQTNINRSFNTTNQGFMLPSSNNMNNSRIEIAKDDNLIKEAQYIKDKRNKISNLLSSWTIKDGESMAELLQSSNLTLIQSMFKCFAEELESKYILIPATERQNLQRLVDIERVFLKHVKDIVDIFQKHSKQMNDKDQYIQNLVQNMSVQQKANEKCIDQINECKMQENDLLHINLKEKQYEQSTISLNLQNIKLSSQVEGLVKKIQEIESTIDVEALKKEIRNLKKMIDEQNMEFKEVNVMKEKQISVAQITVGSLKITNTKLEKEIAILRDAFQKHTIQISTLTAENEYLIEENNHYRERLFMQQEDIDGKNIRGQETKDLLKKFQTAYKKLQEKMDRITLDKSVNIDPPENIEFEDERRFFETVKAVYKNNPLFTKRIKAEYYGLNANEVSKKIKEIDDKPKVFQNQTQLSANSSDPSFNINHYRFYKFSFFTFVQQRYDAILKNNQNIYKFRKVTNLFVGTLRAILDSKWNEAMTMDNYQTFSDFSDFTFSWLSTFCVDRTTRKITFNIELSENDQSVREQQLANFFIDLSNPILNKLWEIVTFREFLSADTSTDEIYFYLHCRNLLFKGPQLEYMESTFQPIHYIRFAHARHIIELVMCRYDQTNIEFMIGTLYKKCSKKNGNNLIDSGLVLRLLLEYYRAERIQRYRIIKELFYSQQGHDVNGQFTLSFDSFCKIFDDNYKGTTFQEKAQLYRDCITIGNGMVTSDIFYVVATERNFFMKNLRLKMLSELPEFDKTTQKLEPDYDYRAKMLTKFFEDSRNKLKGCLKFLKEYSMNQGLESNYMKVNELLGYIHDLKNFNLDSTTIQGKNIPLYFSQLVMKANQVAEIQMYSICQAGVNVGENELMELVLNRFDNTLNFISDFLESRRSKSEIRKHLKLKKFQTWIKKKISKWYNILNVLLLAKLAEALKQEKQ